MTDLDQAFGAVSAHIYSNHERYGETVHRSLPEWIRREVAALQVHAGDRVLEVGTGSGYSGALLAKLCGPQGRVTSVDISDELIRRATAIHAERGVTGVDCHVADGLAGYPAAAPFDRAVAWCTPPLLLQAWVEQVVDGGRIVACLPIAALPSTTLIATITVTAGQPRVEAVTGGGYAQSTPTAVDDAQTIPGRWVDHCDHQPDPSWIGICWRAADDAQHTGAHAALDQLLHPGHTETYRQMEADWRSWSAYTAALGDPQLSLVSLRNEIRGIGHTTASSAAVILTDGTILADSPTSPSLLTLRAWLDRWEHTGRPAPESFPCTLVPHDGPDLAGWDLRVSHATATTRPGNAAPNR
ncbi:protein-L-isoaspartate(D-aspartate) O-methyltransferase [Actinoplanes sp. ATCC 53533]|uniref:protein-L-isoaspartate O-methyltransferase family protein n=1 Tax=Actinoplanes sp. ATCC 53533 TaxID=1288362 RepID=UPI000F7AC651|nr:methyltransferase domain-containing protein [Actinoplanes sp. ATCC 53533]RSM53969.1 protein-L-isoaspartate(D-aspartate) O-methyltransferase [Actinoplanes sp. ATCC 53533]